jgi:membrane associated rhomboid family serine protease
MPLLSKLERHLGRYAVPNLSLYLVFGQATVYLAMLLGRLDRSWFVFVPQLALMGQWWRVLTFLLMPPPMSVIFIGFAWWIFYMMGSALEDQWGTFRYNVFIFLGAALTIALSFLRPEAPVSNTFLAGSVFLAFAFLNPDFELLLFFVLPVKIKWLAAVTWVLYGLQFFSSDWAGRLQIIAAVGNFLIFFGRDLVHGAAAGRRRMAMAASRAAEDDRAGEPRHRCRVCGKTDVSNPEMDFRYCSKCAGEECYCPEHIRNHEHVLAAGEPAAET